MARSQGRAQTSGCPRLPKLPSDGAAQDAYIRRVSSGKDATKTPWKT